MNIRQRARVLCVDDEAEVVNGLALHLRRHYDLLTSTSGADALELLRCNADIAVIMADMRMPGMDGAEFLARSRELLPDAQRILLTGQIDLASAIAAVNEGQICRFLTKPCPPPVLLDAVAAAVLLYDAHDRAHSAMRSKLEHEHLQLDVLTGLLSRHALLGSLEAAVFDPAMADGSLAAYFIEVDIADGGLNDGDIPWGDEVAVIMAKRLKKAFPHGEVVARWGIDQFVVTVHGSATGDAELRVGADALVRLLKEPVRVREHAETVGVSIGVAQSADRSQWQRLVQQAAMAAREGRITAGTGAYLYRHDDPPRAERQRTLLLALRQAIAGNRLHLNYQPIVDTRRNRVRGIECLVRWQHGNVAQSPANFIPLAEQSGDIHELGRWVLWQACHEGLVLARDHAVRLAVNVSPLQLGDPTFLPYLEECLSHSGLSPDSLELEITETAFAGNLAKLRDAVAAVRGLGVHLAIDDFGSGYSSLAYIAQLPVDLIKVDGVFARDLDHGGASVIRAAQSLANDLGRELVIEGVETGEMLTQLKALGCDLFQGYVFAKPMPASDIAAWLHSFRLSGGSK